MQPMLGIEVKREREPHGLVLFLIFLPVCLPAKAEAGAAQVALNIPDELTLDHIWKDKKREYSFDAVFAPGATQEKARPVTC